MKKYLWFILILLVTACTVTPPNVTTKSNKTTPPKEKQEEKMFSDFYSKADQTMKKMSLEEKVGQLFLTRMDQATVDSVISSYHPGGFVLFARDFENETKDSITNKIKTYQEKSNIPLIMAVDEEGGIVTRVSRYPNFRQTRFPSNQDLYQEGGFDLIEQVEQEKIDLLKSLGLNLNLAPVADVSTNSNDYIYSRSLGQDAAITSEYISRLVSLDVKNTFANSLKHFPGYGNNVDTHTGIAIDERSYENFVANDYLPFQAGIQAKSPTILVSHNIVKALDATYPASLSPKIHEELRKTLKFTGLIITDDLSMDAILDYTNNEDSAVLAVLAGNDLLITSDIDTHYQKVLEAVQTSKIPSSLLEDAVRRILAFKYQYHIA